MTCEWVPLLVTLQEQALPPCRSAPIEVLVVSPEIHVVTPLSQCMTTNCWVDAVTPHERGYNSCSRVLRTHPLHPYTLCRFYSILHSRRAIMISWAYYRYLNSEEWCGSPRSCHRVKSHVLSTNVQVIFMSYKLETFQRHICLPAYFKIPICTFHNSFLHTLVTIAITYGSLDQVFHSLNQAILRNDKTEPADLKALRTGNIPIGVFNQYGSTWEFVWGLLRDFPMGAWYPIVQCCDKRSSGDSYLYTTEQIVDLMVTLSQPYIPFLRYVGFIEMAHLFDGAMVFAPAATRAELRRFACSFLRYLNWYTSYALF